MKKIDWNEPVFSRADVINLLQSVFKSLTNIGVVDRVNTEVQFLGESYEYPYLGVGTYQKANTGEQQHYFTIDLNPTQITKETPRN